ncbi:MAG: twin-arginine translocase subunit TatC [Lentisphaerota bacterium]
MEHLEDLRRMLFGVLISLGVGVAVALPFAPQALGLLKQPLRTVTSTPDLFLRSLEVGGAFSLSLQIAFWMGLLISAPVMIYFIGAFLFPGLTQREQRVVMRSSGFAALLFLIGVFVGFYWILPLSLKMMFGLHQWMGITAEWTVTSYVGFSIQLLLGFGLAFELPVLVLVLGKLGVFNSAQLREKRKFVILMAFVIGALLTPPDVTSQLMMAIPLIGLFEMCIWLLWWEEKKKSIDKQS